MIFLLFLFFFFFFFLLASPFWLYVEDLTIA